MKQASSTKAKQHRHLSNVTLSLDPHPRYQEVIIQFDYGSSPEEKEQLKNYTFLVKQHNFF